MRISDWNSDVCSSDLTRCIRVNAIRPGMIPTPMNARAVADAEYRASLEKNIPMRRAGKPEEVAAMARWLASDEAAYVTGASYTIDGGRSLLRGPGAGSAPASTSRSGSLGRGRPKTGKTAG